MSTFLSQFFFDSFWATSSREIKWQQKIKEIIMKCSDLKKVLARIYFRIDTVGEEKIDNTVFTYAGALAAAADVVVLAVKPRVVPAVTVRISDALAASRPLVVSIAAGIGLARLESLLPEGARVVRAMPNMAAGVGQSMTALTAGAAADESDLATARALMDSVGRTVLIAEEDFSIFVGLAGSAPAFISRLGARTF